MHKALSPVFSHTGSEASRAEAIPLREGPGHSSFMVKKTEMLKRSPVKAIGLCHPEPGSTRKLHRHVNRGEAYYSGSGEYYDNEGLVRFFRRCGLLP